MRKFKAGAWVMNIQKGLLGYVVSSTGDYTTVKITKVTSYSVYATGTTITNIHERFTPVDTKIHPDDAKVMIDLALQTNDQDWFNELVEVSAKT